ncbi:putative TetR family transcriptional regulator [Vibrio ezurae NBRC 102218]|uniref:Putative TetR family transcriptional regulator n=1 Tax=Vibrio ezurae NBRC 102218 TaxID=1219080 RepID=U3CLR6_9VIBR|nr:putative TetR family transcriptional regulator [Vibrio ezurae NBRC 102218]
MSRHEYKKQQILLAAGQLFAEHGYRVSMDAIAKAANVSKQTVYAHFGTKDALFETCIQSKCITYRITENEFNYELSLQQMLVEFGMRFQSLLLEEGVKQTYRNAISQLESHPDLASMYLESGPKNTITTLSHYLSEKLARESLNLGIDMEDAAMQLLLLFHGRAVYFANLGEDSQESDEQREKYIRSCVELFLRGNGLL